jgi:hypothetical protein
MPLVVSMRSPQPVMNPGDLNNHKDTRAVKQTRTLTSETRVNIGLINQSINFGCNLYIGGFDALESCVRLFVELCGL